MSGERKVRRPLRIVLAEDNDDHAVLVQMALERASAAPVALRRARDGDEAVALVEAEAPDLLLLDLKMPGRTGHEVLERLKGDPELRKVPVAVLTSSDRDEDVARSYGLGGNHFITKPDDPAQLEEKLRRLLHNLSDLRSIQRGSAGLQATAATAQGPASRRNRAVLAWVTLAVIVGALAVYALAAGAL